MNMYCDGCGRDDFCLCLLPENPTMAAIQILDAARGEVLNQIVTCPEHDEQIPAVIWANADILTRAIAYLEG